MLTISNPATFDWAGMSLKDCAEGNAMDSHYTLLIYDILKEEVDQLECVPLLEQCLNPLMEDLADIEFRGLDIDIPTLEKVGKGLKDDIIDIEDTIYEHPFVTKTDSLASTHDLRDMLYTREGGLELYPPDRTDTDAPSTNAQSLKTLLTMIEEELGQREKQKKN